MIKHTPPSHTLIFATGNSNKLKEVRQMLPAHFELKGLSDIGCNIDIPETAFSLEGNALIKAQYVVRHYGLDCFAEDTGLEIEYLDGAPGIYSARYAGPDKDAAANMQKVLVKMQNATDRKARFRTVIALIADQKEYLFEGIVNGVITEHPAGENGFGYDPIFQPNGCEQTFAELDDNTKNSISHRARAIEKLLGWLLKNE